MNRERSPVENRTLQDAPTDLHDLLRRDAEGLAALTPDQKTQVLASLRAYTAKLGSLPPTKAARHKRTPKTSIGDSEI